MGCLVGSWEPPSWSSPCVGLLLAAFVLGSCLQPVSAQLSIVITPQSPAVGGDVSLAPQPPPQNFILCKWYRAGNTEDETRRIFTYTGTAQNNGPAHTGRETAGPGCALNIAGLMLSDTGNYMVQLDLSNGPAQTLRVDLPVYGSTPQFVTFVAKGWTTAPARDIKARTTLNSAVYSYVFAKEIFKHVKKRAVDPQNATSDQTTASSKTDSPKSDTTKTEAPRTDSVKPDTTKTERSKTDSAKPDTTKTEASKTDSVEPDTTKTEASKTDSAKLDTTNREAPTTDSPKPDTKTETPKTDSPTPDTTKTEASKTDSPTPDTAKTEASKTDSPTPDTTKREAPKTDAQSTGTPKSTSVTTNRGNPALGQFSFILCLPGLTGLLLMKLLS